MSGSRHARRPPVHHRHPGSGDDVLHVVAAAKRSTSPSAHNHPRGVRCYLPVNSRVGGSRGRRTGSCARPRGTCCARPRGTCRACRTRSSPSRNAHSTRQLVHQPVPHVGEEAAQPSPSFDGGERRSWQRRHLLDYGESKLETAVFSGPLGEPSYQFAALGIAAFVPWGQ